MKALIFTTQFHLTGGHERLAIELAVDLNRIGVRADVLSQYSTRLPGVPREEARIKDAGVPEVWYLGLEVGGGVVGLVRGIYRFRKLVAGERYDVVETSGFAPILIAALALPGTRTKQVIGLHDNYTKEQYNGLRYFVWRQLLRLFRPAACYAISRSVADDWSSYIGSRWALAPVIYNSVNEAFFDSFADRPAFREELGVGPDTRIVLFVGRLLKRKGIDTLLEAVKPLLESENLQLVFVGRTDDTESRDDAALLDGIRAEVACEAWGRRVHFLGQRTDIPRIMASSDVLVHPARREGFGLIIAEALATGLPVIASNVGGIPEVVAGTDSVLVPPGDPRLLTEAIQVVLRWPRERRISAIGKGKRRAADFRSVARARAIRALFASVNLSTNGHRNNEHELSREEI
jgi:glycosyltransferase involved in cell wall biosynthesis